MSKRKATPAAGDNIPLQVWWVTQCHDGERDTPVSPYFETREQAEDFIRVKEQQQPGAKFQLLVSHWVLAGRPPRWTSPVYMRDGGVIPTQEVRS